MVLLSGCKYKELGGLVLVGSHFDGRHCRVVLVLLPVAAAAGCAVGVVGCSILSDVYSTRRQADIRK